jgi:predicted secreted protein
MSSSAIPAQGTTLGIGSGSPVTYQTIPEINSFSGPGGSAQVIDVTDLSSTAKEKRMGLQDNGQLTFEMNFIPDNTVHAALRTAKASGAITPFKLTFSDGSYWTFNGFVTAVPISGGVDGVVKGSCTIEISGSILES